MAIAVSFRPKGMTLEQFSDISRRLGSAGQYPHLLHHSCCGDDGDLMVFQIWESKESFEAFGRALMPILAEVGVDPGQPSVMAVHDLTQSEQHVPL